MRISSILTQFGPKMEFILMFKLKILFHPNQHRTHVVDLNSFFRLGGYKSISSDASANLEVEVLYDIINLILLTAAEAKTRGCSLIGK